MWIRVPVWLREQAHALDRLDLGDRRPRLDVRERIGPALGLELADQVLHDLVVLGVEADAEAGLRRSRAGPRASSRRRVPGCSRSSRRGSTCSRRRRPRPSDVSARHAVLDEQADDPEVDVRLLLRQASLELDVLGACRSWGFVFGMSTTVVTPPIHRRRRSGSPVLLVLEAGLAEMHVAVDHAREHVLARRVVLLARRVTPS